MKKKSIFKRIISTALAVALSVTAMASNFTASASVITVKNVGGEFYQFTNITGLENGLSAFCIEYGKSADTGDDYKYEADSHTLNDYQKEYITLAQYYGYPNAFLSDDYFCATQAVIWEVTEGLRNLPNYWTDSASTQGFTLKSSKSMRGKLLNSTQKSYYDTLVSKIQNHAVRPSGTAMNASDAHTYVLKYNPSNNKYEVLISDSNAQLLKYNLKSQLESKLSAYGVSVKINSNGSQMRITADKEFSTVQNVLARQTFKDAVRATKIVTWVNSTKQGGDDDADGQHLNYGAEADPVYTNINLRTEKTGSTIVSKVFKDADGKIVYSAHGDI